MSLGWDDGQFATLACLLEATAEKPGNVHPGAHFRDMNYTDMVMSAIAIGPIFRQATVLGVGPTVMAAVQATHNAVGKNTNLGTIMLLAVIAGTDPAVPLDPQHVLKGLTELDARLVYAAVRLAQPGGLGVVDQYDVRDEPPVCLLRAMRVAAARDSIARQYATDFQDVRDRILPRLCEGHGYGWSLSQTIVHVHVLLMSESADSLIARKCGTAIAAESQRRAGQVLAAGNPGEPAYQQILHDFDRWLRADGHTRNPGTTADLIAAGLFAGLRSGQLSEYSELSFVRLKEPHARPQAAGL